MVRFEAKSWWWFTHRVWGWTQCEHPIAVGLNNPHQVLVDSGPSMFWGLLNSKFEAPKCL